MAIYCVSYDLKTPGKKYEDLYDKLKSFNGYNHILDSTWLVCSNQTASDVYDTIQPAIDKNDSVFISKVNPNEYSGWLSQAAWDWIRRNM